MSQTDSTLLIVGCGDIGCRLATRLANQYQVFGLRRQTHMIPQNITPLQGDITNPESLSCLSRQPYDYVVMTLTPEEFSETAYRRAYIDGTRNVLLALAQPPKRIFWVSSTSVFSETQGHWVDETSPTSAPGFSGRCLREAEHLIESCGSPHTLIRFAGIYGPGRRRLINQVIAGKGSPKEPTQWTNRIHVDDCAGVLAHLIQLDAESSPLEDLYIACDSQPTPMYDVKQWLATELGTEITSTEPSKMPGNRRCNNARLLTTGYQFQHPDFRSGYRAILQN